MNEIDVLSVRRGSVTAPAGCGKTNLIATALKRHQGGKPVLILTHTNAGVCALRMRVSREGVAKGAAQIRTIDGWAMQLVLNFPSQSGVPKPTLNIVDGINYPAFQNGAVELLRKTHLNHLIKASYSQLLVDEYQDCSEIQHTLILLMSEILGTCVFGDPLQTIFDFGPSKVVPWELAVLKSFPLVGDLQTPWRWRNANSEALGDWLLAVRAKLLKGLPIDLRDVPDAVQWIQLDGINDQAKLVRAAKTEAPNSNGSVLVIGDSKSSASRFKIARGIKGMIALEAVSLSDLITFADSLDLAHETALRKIVHFAESLMTNVGAEDLLKRVDSINSGRAKKNPNRVETAALAFLKNRTYKSVSVLIGAIGADFGVETFRPAVVHATLRALESCPTNLKKSFRAAASAVREQSRLNGRSLPKRAIGSTLLVKGLEADVAVVLHPQTLNVRNLYVAMTRGSRKLVLCSSSHLLEPSS